MARFPFTTRGHAKDDPAVQHGREEFPALFTRLMGQPTRLTVADWGQNELQLIDETVTLPPEKVEESDGGRFRLGNLGFERIDGAWKLVDSYTWPRPELEDAAP